MATIVQTLQDEIDYPVKIGKLNSKLMKRGLDGSDEMTAEIAGSSEFQGAIADCLYNLIAAPNFSDSGTSISLPDRKLILKMANSIYLSIGEKPKDLDIPMVYIGADL